MQKTPDTDPMLRTNQEEFVNSLTHGAGLALSIVAAGVLMATAWQHADSLSVLGCALYAFTLVAVYLFSTLSHAVSHPILKLRFRILDQAFIYLLIAGTYTPLSLAYLRSGTWSLLLLLMWALALYGFYRKAVHAHRVNATSLVLYVALGWIPVLAVRPLLGLVPDALLWWMLAGGLFYTGGTVFLSNDWRGYHLHALWHLCVIAGSVCHYWPIWRYVAHGE